MNLELGPSIKLLAFWQNDINICTTLKQLIYLERRGERGKEEGEGVERGRGRWIMGVGDGGHNLSNSMKIINLC